MRHLMAFGAALAFAVGCGGDFSTNQDRSGVRGTGALPAAGGASTGGSRVGGASATGGAPGGPSGSGGAAGGGGFTTGGTPGAECRTNADCPQLGCFMCPASVCVNGQCVSSGGPGSGGVAGTGGSTATGGAVGGCSTDSECVVPAICQACPSGGTSCATGVCVNGQCQTSFPPCPGGSGGSSDAGSAGNLKWYPTCGPPVCRVPSPGSGGTSSGYPPCTTTEVPGAPCTNAGAECDDGSACSGPLLCTTSDPTSGGMCPKSRAEYKTDIEYLSAAERGKLADDVQSIPLVRYRYKDGPEREHLGFIIEDVEPSPSVDGKNDRVDLYGYTSMAVAAIQEQHREIEALKREIKALRSELARRSSKAPGAKSK